MIKKAKRLKFKRIKMSFIKIEDLYTIKPELYTKIVNQ